MGMVYLSAKYRFLWTYAQLERMRLRLVEIYGGPGVVTTR